jgi:hypothetical protein
MIVRALRSCTFITVTLARATGYTSSVRLRWPYASAMAIYALDELFRSSLLIVNSEGFVPRRGLCMCISMALFSVNSSEQLNPGMLPVIIVGRPDGHHIYTYMVRFSYSSTCSSILCIECIFPASIIKRR